MSLQHFRGPSADTGLPSISLSAARDVEVSGGLYSAISETPWLRIDFQGQPPAGRWIRLTYLASLLDPLVRPLVRCFVGDRHHDEILPGALFGRAVWIGLIPEGAEEIWISPTNRRGPFGFSIESIAKLSSAELIWRCLRQNPGRCLTGLGARLVGLRFAGDNEFRRVLSAARLKDYHAWRSIRRRDLDLACLDAPRANWENGPRIRFVTCLPSGERDGVQPILSELRAQPYPRWTLTVISSSASSEIRGSNSATSCERIILLGPDAMACELLEGLSEHDIVAPVSPGDRLPAYAVAVLAEAAVQHPASDIFYGDQEYLGPDGKYGNPLLLPDWSPSFYAASPYTEGAEFFRVSVLKPFAGELPAADLVRSKDIISRCSLREQAGVCHIRRVMRTRIGAPTAPGTARYAPNSNRSALRTEAAEEPCATIIIPTRDRLELLECCINSLKKQVARRDIEVIVIDNGSVQHNTRRFLADLEQDNGFRVVAHPGAFNFSRLCNDAAAEARAATLVFLNNDTEIIDEHWLEPLLYWARKKDVGAVGAKLLYPNGRVQHAGVVVGIDGRAGHFERMLKQDNPGYFGRLCVPHEVSAVTAACLAVEKKKFDAVGGFDVNLMVELNDIDLCLRLSEQGWKSICTPDSLLIHHESASRGTTLRPDVIHQKEHSYFRARWMHRLRDDQFFHPALSLARLDAALG